MSAMANDPFKELHARVDALRARVVHLEAMAHAAAGVADELPFRPTEEEEARTVRRTQSLALATANEAERVLDAMDDLVEEIDDMENRYTGSKSPSGTSG